MPTSEKTRERYCAERDKLFRELGNRDPHIIPRNLYLIGGVDKQRYIDAQELPLFGRNEQYVARNKRLNRSQVVTYDDVTEGNYIIIELPHRFIDFSDFVRRTGQVDNRVLMADLKVDRWYFQRYTDWAGRIYATYASLSE